MTAFVCHNARGTTEADTISQPPNREKVMFGGPRFGSTHYKFLCALFF